VFCGKDRLAGFVKGLDFSLSILAGFHNDMQILQSEGRGSFWVLFGCCLASSGDDFATHGLLVNVLYGEQTVALIPAEF
jgi:hypothetical protein